MKPHFFKIFFGIIVLYFLRIFKISKKKLQNLYSIYVVCCIHFHTNPFKKGMNPSVLSSNGLISRPVLVGRESELKVMKMAVANNSIIFPNSHGSSHIIKK